MGFFVELRETVYLESQPSIDEDAGLIRNVKLLGTVSKNGRRYTQEALTGAVSLYKGKKIYVDHPREGGDRSYDRWAGTVQESRIGSDGIYGDVKLRKQSGYFAGILEAANDFPTDVGFSHVADGESRLEGDTEIVESIREVFSVDLVTDPATTKGFYESEQTMKKKTAKQIAEEAPKDTPLLKRLIEQLDDAVPAEMEVEAEPDPAEEVKAALKKAATAVIQKLFDGEIEEADAMKEIKKILGLKDQATEGDEGTAEVPAPAEESNKELAALQRKFALQEAKGLLLESGREASEPAP